MMTKGHEIIGTQYDTAIFNAYILTLDEEWREFNPGMVLIKDGCIDYAGPLIEHSSIKAAEAIDARGNILMPSFFNGHTHSAMSIFRGLGSDQPLDDWLNDHIWPAEARYANEQNIFPGSMASAIEMIRGGTGIFVDMYFFQEETIRACEELGIRIIAGEGILDFPTPNKKTPGEGLKYTEHLARKYKGHPLVDISLPAHAPYSCSPGVIRDIGELAYRLGITATIHLAETRWEVEEMMNRYGKSSTQYLYEQGFFQAKTVAYHCNHLSAEDMLTLKDNNVGVVTNPRSNMKLGSGLCPVPELRSLGISIGIGTDGAASNNNQDILPDMQLLARLYKMDQLDPTIISAKQAIRMAINNNCLIYGKGDRLGSIEAGKQADLIIIDTDQPHWHPLYDPYSHICYAMQPGDVATTIINGKIIMKDREILTVDEDRFKRAISLLGEEIARDMA